MVGFEDIGQSLRVANDVYGLLHLGEILRAGAWRQRGGRVASLRKSQLTVFSGVMRSQA